MTNKSTKSKLISSLLVLALCLTMFAGSTYAWFTDEVVSAGNKIQAGNLDIDLLLKDGANWNSIGDSEDAIFDDSILWEPGYTAVRTIKIVNEGNLALKFKMQMAPKGVVSKLADVIDVYFFPGVESVSREEIAAATKVGNLGEMVLSTDPDGVVYGILLPEDGDAATSTHEIVGTIALKMQESAGNEYQDAVVGEFDIQILATQLTAEEDSFNDQYDVDAEYGTTYPVAFTTPLPVEGITAVPLDTAYKFVPKDSDVANSPYKEWHVDFEVSFDEAINTGDVTLAGSYGEWNSGSWVWFDNPMDLAAGETVRLLKYASETYFNTQEAWTYEQIFTIVSEFCCGAAEANEGALDGKTMTVKLVLYEANGNTFADEDGFEEVVIGSYDYTF